MHFLLVPLLAAMAVTGITVKAADPVHLCAVSKAGPRKEGDRQAAEALIKKLPDAEESLSEIAMVIPAQVFQGVAAVLRC